MAKSISVTSANAILATATLFNACLSDARHFVATSAGM